MTLRILLVLLAFSSVVLSAEKADSYTWDGIWYNELGSCMKLSTYPSTNITGLYVSPKASGSEAARGTVAGQYKLDDDTFSFSVTWHNYPSTTGWAGEYKYDASSKPVLYTTWLLVSKTESIGDLWGNTLVGKDTFARDPFVDNDCETFLVDQRKTEL